MNRVLVLCEDPPNPTYEDLAPECNKRVELRAFTEPRNLRFESPEEKLYECLDPLALDLARVGAYVYSADRLVSRGEVDVEAQSWRRSFSFVVPVSDPDRWNAGPVHTSLQEALSFLTEDQYQFRFVLGPSFARGQTTLFRDPRLSEADSVALFSGGLDSLAGVVWHHVKQQRSPILVSHRSAPVVDARQKGLLKLLRERFPKWHPVHVPAWINFIDNWEQEHTQRSRSFLYIALAAAVAHQLSKTTISVYENGVVSINLPVSHETVGARVTRTTHPKFIRSISGFLAALLSSRITIDTPFLFLTKKEVAARLAEATQPDIIAASTSCGHTFMATKAHPHCGVCSQCLDRRVALMAADLEAHDTPYKYDAFIDPLSNVDEAAQAKPMVLGFFRTYLRLANLTPEQLCQEYPQVYDVTDSLPRHPEDTVQEMHRLYERQAADVRTALLKAHDRAAQDLIDGLLPDDCLLRMLYGGEHHKEPLEFLARRLSGIAEDSLPLTFAHARPADETPVQDALQAAFAAAQQDLTREFPYVTFSLLKHAKPDFAAAAGRLFVEVKYPHGKHRTAGAIGEEIAADITIYRANKACILFVIYDPESKVTRRKELVSELEAHDGVFACVVR